MKASDKVVSRCSNLRIRLSYTTLPVPEIPKRLATSLSREFTSSSRFIYLCLAHSGRMNPTVRILASYWPVTCWARWRVCSRACWAFWAASWVPYCTRYVASLAPSSRSLAASRVLRELHGESKPSQR
jgi:hypothetical protein